MPRKAGAGAQDKKVKKVVEDKTFGLKNKNKSKKVQQYVKNVEQQAAGGNKKKKAFEEPKKTKKELEAERAAEMAQIFKPVVDMKGVESGVDPKSILCQFFAQGTCKKGAKCRYSHDKTVVRKVNKIDVYTDVRKEDEKKDEDTMDKWSQDQLEDVVRKKQGSDNSNLQTNIVCKYFLEAIESQKYGWFWECPNGGDQCKYRHALPPGFVLKAPGEQREEEEEEATIEEILEEERQKLKERMAETGGGTPVTLERFLEWREKRKAMKEELRVKEEQARNKKDSKADREHRKLLSGREMFVFKPDLFVDDDAADEDEFLYRREDSDDEEVHELEATGTSLTRTVLVGGKRKEGEEDDKDKEEEEDEEEGKEKGNEEGSDEEGNEEGNEGSGIPINEELFEDDAGDLSDSDLAD